MKQLLRFFLKRSTWSIPYAIFLVGFVVLPLILIFLYAFQDAEGNFTLANFSKFLKPRGSQYVCLFYRYSHRHYGALHTAGLSRGLHPEQLGVVPFEGYGRTLHPTHVDQYSGPHAGYCRAV